MTRNRLSKGDVSVGALHADQDVVVGGTLTNGTLVLVDPQSDIADLGQDISATYVEAEVQAISDKVDAILAALRSAGVLA